MKYEELILKMAIENKSIEKILVDFDPTNKKVIEDKRKQMKKCEYCFDHDGEILWNVGFINNEWLCLECGSKVENKEEDNK